MSRKGAKIDVKIHPKFAKGAKGEPRGRQKSQKDRKKGMPKTRTEKGGKMDPKCLGTAECAWPLFAYPAYKKGLLGLLATGSTRPAPLAGARRIQSLTRIPPGHAY